MTSAVVRPAAMPRLHYLDNLRATTILLVVVHHAAQAYGPADWWYVTGQRRCGALATLSAVGGAFRMSLLFLVAAYLAAGAVDRKGDLGFLRDRLRRLGIPFLVGSATIIPALMYAHYTRYRGYPPISFGHYYGQVFLGLGPRPADWTGPAWPDLQFGHLWFIQNLLALSALYVLLRRAGGLLRRLCGPLRRAGGRPPRPDGPPCPAGEARHRRRPRPTPAQPAWVPGGRALAAGTVALAAVVFLIRIRYPLDTWVPLLGFIQAEPARLAQYTTFFAAGVLAYRHDWLARLPRATGYRWLAIGGVLSAVLFATGTDTEYFAPGGASWPSACWTLVETTLCVGLGVGLLVLFREVFAGHNRLSRALAGASYTIYLIHLPVVVALQFALAPAGLPALVAFAAVAIAGTLISVILAMPLRRLPGLRAVI